MIKAAIYLAIVGAVIGAFASVYHQGIKSERTAALTKGVELVKERDALNVKVKTASAGDVCRRLGGVWMPDTNECG